MLPHIIENRIKEAEAAAIGMRNSAAACAPEQDSLRTRLLQWAECTNDVCDLARQLGLAAIVNRDTIINRRAS